MGDNEWGQPEEGREEEKKEQPKTEDKSAKKDLPKKSRKTLYFALIVIILIAGAASYFFLTRQVSEQTFFILSPYEQSAFSAEADTKAFGMSDKIHILAGREGKKLEADSLKISIERSAGGSFIDTKSITFELDKSYGKISTFIPPAYFSAPGRYRVTAYLDSGQIGQKEIDITE